MENWALTRERDREKVRVKEGAPDLDPHASVGAELVSRGGI